MNLCNSDGDFDAEPLNITAVDSPMPVSVPKRMFRNIFARIQDTKVSNSIFSFENLPESTRLSAPFLSVTVVSPEVRMVDLRNKSRGTRKLRRQPRRRGLGLLS